MKTMLKRGAGVLMPIFSLPSPYGIGTFGRAAYEFIDQLKRGRQMYWADLLWGQPVPVLFCIRGKSVFYRSGYAEGRGTPDSG